MKLPAKIIGTSARHYSKDLKEQVVEIRKSMNMAEQRTTHYRYKHAESYRLRNKGSKCE